MVMLMVLTAAGIPISSLSLYEGDGFFFHEEMEVEGSDQDILWLNALQYSARVKKAGQRKAAKPQLGKNSISQEGSFYVYTKGLLSHQIHGEIIFKIKVEVSGNRYNYTFSDFIFQFYQKNRYGRFVPVSGKIKPLEDEKYAGMQEIWEEHKSLTRKVAENHIRVLKKEMQKVPPSVRSKEERNLKDWN